MGAIAGIATGEGAENILSGSSQIYPAPIVGGTELLVNGIGGGYGEDVVVASRIVGIDRIVIASGRNHDNPLCIGLVKDILQSGTIGVAPPGDTDHVSPGGDGIGNALIAQKDDAGIRCVVEGTFDRHDLDAMPNPRYAEGVICRSTDNTGEVGTMRKSAIGGADRRIGVVVIVGYVPTVDIIYIAIAVIVNPIIGDFSGVDPNIGQYIFMGNSYSIIHDGHHRGAPCMKVPGLSGLYQLEVVLLAVLGIIGEGLGAAQRNGFCIFEIGKALQLLQKLPHPLYLMKTDFIGPVKDRRS